MELTQTDADNLIIVPKVRENEKVWAFPYPHGIINVPLLSEDGVESFILDIRQTKIACKITLQKRCRKIIGLLRLDCGGSPHKNPEPDNREIPCPHLHTYREGYGLTFAEPVPKESFKNLDDSWQVLQDFMDYCNIVSKPIIQSQRDIFHEHRY